ncbi:hypothetical protein SJZ97_18395 [Acinetobacter nosocomialis]|nr:hypothetical protein [Acinetobacter nosocomialis]MDX7882270.1 hypothetical protein [Acinetobacter nosocomialis]
MTFVTKDTARENSGALQNNFDKDRVQSEINLQIDVTKNFDANRQEAGITVDNIVKALEVTGQAIEGAKQTLAIAKQAQQEIQKLSPEDQVIFENFLTELAQSQKADRTDSYYPLVLAAGEGLAMAAAACARSPACASATVNVLGAVGVAILNEQSDDKNKKTTPRPLPSTSGNSATGMPPERPENDKTQKAKDNITGQISKYEKIVSYEGREAANNGGLRKALEDFARTGEKVGTKNPSNHIQKARDILRGLDNQEKLLQKSTINSQDKAVLQQRIQSLRNEIEPSLKRAITKQNELNGK